MFDFDESLLPQLTTRKAFIGIDFQNDFTSPTGALPVTDPDGFVDRAIQLSNVCREVGDVIWVQSRFDQVRPVVPEQIIASDLAPPKVRPSSRGRPRISLAPDDSPPDPEAFLSHGTPLCLRPDGEGGLMTTALKEATHKSDVTLTKTHYSAFNSTPLLHLLRAKMVMEVFICGSLANIGVYATAMDAATHGMSITIVEDCCGFRSETRQTKAISKLVELAGCEIATCEEVVESIRPKPKPAKRPDPSRTPPTDLPEKRRKSETPEIVKTLTGLRLASDSPTPVPSPAATGHQRQQLAQPQAKAPTTAEADQPESQNAPSSKPKEDNGENPAPVFGAGEVDIDVDDAVKKDCREAPNGEDTKPQHSSSSSSTTTTTPTAPTPATATAETATPKSIDSQIPQTTMAHSKIQAEPEEGRFLQKGLCAGDTDVIENVLPSPLADGIFEKLREEVQWQRMSHQGGEVPRLVAVQGHVAEDGTIPVYRHPSDESPPLLPFSPSVLAIKEETEKHLGHPLNHVLIQYYRDGNDYISEHSDKTLDIVPGTYIANVSLGAQRTMVFRTKRLDKDPSRTGPAPTNPKRQVQRARLPHNSLCRMGLKTNEKWLHAIRQDKRADRDKSPAELAFDGGRISLTFRQIGTFLDRGETRIWGQGATSKTREGAKPVINGQTDEAIVMLKAFGTENHAADFDWAAHYGKGFDVLHMSNAPRLFASADPVVNNRIAFMLAEAGINYAKGSMGETQPSEDLAIKFVDNDAAKTVVRGDLAIMLYLNAQHGAGKAETPRTAPELAKQFTRFQQGLNLLGKYRSLEKDADGKPDIAALGNELAVWETYASEAEDGLLAGETPTLPDFGVWPVLHQIVEDGGENVFDGLDGLKPYYERVLERESVKKMLGKTA